MYVQCIHCTIQMAQCSDAPTVPCYSMYNSTVRVLELIHVCTKLISLYSCEWSGGLGLVL